MEFMCYAVMTKMSCMYVFQVLLVSSSRHPDKWIVPGGGMEPEEEPNVAAAREVCEEVGSVATSHKYYSNVS